MPDLSTKKTNHVSHVIQAVVRLLDDVAALKALAAEAQDLHYSDAAPGGLQDSDFVGENAYLSADVYKAVMQTLVGLDAQMAAPGASGGPSVYATFRQMKP